MAGEREDEKRNKKLLAYMRKQKRTGWRGRKEGGKEEITYGQRSSSIS